MGVAGVVDVAGVVGVEATDASCCPDVSSPVNLCSERKGASIQTANARGRNRRANILVRVRCS